MTIHERNNVETAKLRLKIAKLELQVSQLMQDNQDFRRISESLTEQLDSAIDRIARLQTIIDDYETQFETFSERFATVQTPETEPNDLILTPQETELETVKKRFNDFVEIIRDQDEAMAEWALKMLPYQTPPETEPLNQAEILSAMETQYNETKPIDPNEVW